MVYKVSDYCLYDGTFYPNIEVEIRPTGGGAVADVNGDGAVDVADVAAIIDVMAS